MLCSMLIRALSAPSACRSRVQGMKDARQQLGRQVLSVYASEGCLLLPKPSSRARNCYILGCASARPAADAPLAETSVAPDVWLTSSTVLQVAVVLHVGQQRAVPAVVQPVLLLDAAGHHAHRAHGHVLLLHDHGVCLLLLPHWHHWLLRCVLMLRIYFMKAWPAH